MAVTVAEIPVWENPPFPVPVEYVLRRNAEYVVLSFEPNGKPQLHCDMLAASFDGMPPKKVFERLLVPAIHNLGSMRFEREYPDQLNGMIRRKAEALADYPMWERYHELMDSHD